MLGWVVLIVLLIGWQVAAATTSGLTLATFTAASESAIQLLRPPSLSADVLPSLGRVLIGFLLAGTAGAACGLLFGSLRWLDPWVHPLISFFRSIPPSAIIPVVLLVSGLGPQLVLTVIVFGSFWPVLLNTFDGARRIEPLYHDVATVLRVPLLTRIAQVIVPASLPMIMAGLRISLSISVILMVVSEMLASTSGLGFRMAYAQQTFDVPGTYGAVLLLAVIGWALDSIFLVIERQALHWHPAFQRGN